MKKGTQIAYIPHHAKGNINHKDVEFGFVTSESKGGHSHFCPYWRKGFPGELRTVANSEMTPNACLVEHESVSRTHVEWVMSIHCAG